MKKGIQFIKLLFTTFIVLSIFSKCSSSRHQVADNTSSSTSIKDKLDSKNFVFVAQTVNPLRGRFRNLTSSYDVKVSKDTVISYLPYFGRAYTAPMDPSEGGINFTSTNFSYAVDSLKANKWGIVIKPNDRQDVRQMNFTVYDNGKADLNVISNSRDPISFSGYLKH